MAQIPYTFRDESLLSLALTHASTGARSNNERLEFLGDAVLDLVVAEELYHDHLALTEGELTELKAWVVSRRVLARAASALGLDQELHLGQGMRERSVPPSVLANVYEAVLGAIYLDGGMTPAQAFVRASLAGPLERVHRLQGPVNPKQTLQRMAQVATGEPPRYELLAERGHAHAKAFLIAARVGERTFPSAWGRTRKEAERWAAHEALLVLEQEGTAA
jgi:ribonuclease-3